MGKESNNDSELFKQKLVMESNAAKFYNQWEREKDPAIKNNCWKMMVICLMKAEIGGKIASMDAFSKDVEEMFGI